MLPLDPLRALLERYFRLVGSSGVRSASLRALRFLRRRGRVSVDPVLPRWALDVDNPAALKRQSSPLPDERDSSLAPVTALNEVNASKGSVGFIVRVTSAEPLSLARSLGSIFSQIEPTWEILLSPIEGVETDFAGWLDRDWRVRRLPRGVHPSSDLIRAAEYATASFLGVLEQGDTVDEDLVGSILAAAALQPGVDIVYTDEANLTKDGRAEPFFKPDWSPEHFNALNYLGRFVALRKSLVLSIKEYPALSAEAADYALLLDATERARRIEHVDEALYFRAAGSGSAMGGLIPVAGLSEAREALERSAQRENPKAIAEIADPAGTLNIRWPVDANAPITLVILTGMRRREVPGRGDIVLASHFVRSIIERSTCSTYRIVLVDDGDAPDDLLALLHKYGHTRKSFQCVDRFSFAKKANFAVGLAEPGIVILLNDDMEVINPDWIQALAGQATRTAIGAVGARLFYPDGSIQHAGICLGYHGATGHMLHRARLTEDYANFASITRNFSAVTGAAMAFRKSVFEALGGFDERFAIDYNDVDFCLRVRQAGYRIVVTPGADLYHFHNSSLRRTHQDGGEYDAFVSRWSAEIQRDPYFSKHFQRRNNDLPLLDSVEAAS